MHTIFRLDSRLYTTVYTSDANKVRKGIAMNTPDDRDAETRSLKTAHSKDNMPLKDADDNNGIVADDALQTANPAEAARLTDDHDPHHVAKNHKEYDSALMESDK